jgi:hypothetical protein
MLVLSWILLAVSTGVGVNARNDAINSQMENTILEVVSGTAQDIRQGTMDMVMENVTAVQKVLFDPVVLDYALDSDETGLSQLDILGAMSLLNKLEGLTSSTPSLETITLQDSNGVVLIGTDLGKIGNDNSTRADVRDVIGGMTFSESILIVGDDQTPSMFVSFPFVGEVGVISLQLQAEFIHTFLDEVSDTDGVNVYVMDTNGVIIAQSSQSSNWVYHSALDLPAEAIAHYQTGGGSLSPTFTASIQPLYQAVELAHETRTANRFRFCHPDELDQVPGENCENGQWSQEAYEVVPDPVRQTPLFLVLVEVFEEPYLNAARHQILWSGLTALAAGGVLVFSSVMVARSMAKLIQRMAEAAQKAEEELPFEEESLVDISEQKDELGMLSRVLSKMIVALQAREQALKREVKRLRIQIDEKKRQEEVDQISSQEFFIDLQKKAKGFRKKPERI